MNNNTLEGKWNQISGEIQKQWGKLTGDDLDQIHGQREKLIGKVQERYDLDEDEARQQVVQFSDRTGMFT